MFVITRVIELEKGFSESFVQRFQNQSLVEKAPGYIKKEILINDQNPNLDVLRLSIYFEERDYFIAWEKSPEHLAMHQSKQNKEKPQGLINFKLEHFSTR